MVKAIVSVSWLPKAVALQCFTSVLLCVFVLEVIFQILLWLVVSTPLKNMKVNWDDYSQYFWENKIDGNQTTNQYWLLHQQNPGGWESPTPQARQLSAALFSSRGESIRQRATHRLVLHSPQLACLGNTQYWLVVGLPLWKIWKSIGMMRLKRGSPFIAWGEKVHLRVNTCLNA